MDNHERLKEAGFSEKQSISLANVIGSIRKDIAKLTNYLVRCFATMDTREAVDCADGLSTKEHQESAVAEIRKKLPELMLGASL